MEQRNGSHAARSQVAAFTPDELLTAGEQVREAIIAVEWLDEREALAEEGLLLLTTSYGKLTALDEEFLALANGCNGVDDGELLLIPFERTLQIRLLEVAE